MSVIPLNSSQNQVASWHKQPVKRCWHCFGDTLHGAMSTTQIPVFMCQSAALKKIIINQQKNKQRPRALSGRKWTQ